jgi:hypothetical protein
VQKNRIASLIEMVFNRISKNTNPRGVFARLAVRYLNRLLLLSLHNQKPIVFQRQIPILVTKEIYIAFFIGVVMGKVFETETLAQHFFFGRHCMGAGFNAMADHFAPGLGRMAKT